MGANQIGDSDPEIQKLFEVPLEEFTERRNALAKKLKADGDPDGAERIRSLTRPTLAAWAVNQLSHRRGNQIAKLRQAAEAIANERSAAKVREAIQERRQIVDRLVADAEEILRESGRNASSNTMSQIAMTLTSATSADELDVLSSGTLTQPLSGSGFEQALAVAPAPEVSKKEERLRREIAELDASLEDAIARREKARREVSRAESALRDAEHDLAAAEREAERLSDKLERLKQKVSS